MHPVQTYVAQLVPNLEQFPLSAPRPVLHALHTIWWRSTGLGCPPRPSVTCEGKMLFVTLVAHGKCPITHM